MGGANGSIETLYKGRAAAGSRGLGSASWPGWGLKNVLSTSRGTKDGPRRRPGLGEGRGRRIFGACCYFHLLLEHGRILADGQGGLRKMAQTQPVRSVTSPSFTRNTRLWCARVPVRGSPSTCIWYPKGRQLRWNSLDLASWYGGPPIWRCRLAKPLAKEMTRGC